MYQRTQSPMISHRSGDVGKWDLGLLALSFWRLVQTRIVRQCPLMQRNRPLSRHITAQLRHTQSEFDTFTHSRHAAERHEQAAQGRKGSTQSH
jgi:hypothetical protein